MNFEKLSEILRNSAVAGAGGAGFPTYAKLNKNADTIILNCAECEPLLKLHRQVLENYAFEILSALTIIADATQAKDIIIAIKASYEEALEAVKAELYSFPKVKIKLLPEIYPAGDEVVTIYETTKRVVQPGNIPISVGVIVFNVETVLNVYNAITDAKAVTYKYVTVAGEVNNPITVKVPLGTSFKELINLAGGTKIQKFAFLCGGPMTGKITSPLDTVTKTTNAVLVLPQDHYIIQKRLGRVSSDMKRAMSACCQCRMCTDLCPRNLLGHPIEPHNFMRLATSGDTKEIAPFLNTMFCSNCGLCEMYSCMQNLSPRTLISQYKDGLKKNGIGIPKDVLADQISKTRDYKKVPMSRLTARLGLTRYNVPAPLKDELFDAKKVKIMLSQHIGAPATPIVKKGDKVTCGQLIGNYTDDKLGIGVHASIDGVVTDVNDKYITIKK